MPLSDINVIYRYLEEQQNEKYDYNILKAHENKIVGLSIHKANKNKPFKTFYNMKYKIGTDDLEIEDALKKISEAPHQYLEGYSAKLRKEFNMIKEPLCKNTIKQQPSMAPIIYAKTNQEFLNVQCWDITSAYPYLLTQPLPHYVGYVDFISEEMFNDDKFTYYGGIKISDLRAKRPYYPLTLIGKNDNKITVESQGTNIINKGKQIIAADEVVLYGFIPHLLQLLKENYSYSDYKITKTLIKFELKIEQSLRDKILEIFENKQMKKRAGLKYGGEKVLLNRVYGFFITKGNNAPAHFSQYIVSKERLIINKMIHEIGFKDIVHSHTDSIKFIGNHSDVIEKYNDTVEFPELGRFTHEGTFEKCYYYSYITAKYLEDGILKFKHGGIDELGIQHLYKMKYEEIDCKTQFALIKGYHYSKEIGYFCEFIKSNFAQSVDWEGENHE